MMLRFKRGISHELTRMMLRINDFAYYCARNLRTAGRSRDTFYNQGHTWSNQAQQVSTLAGSGEAGVQDGIGLRAAFVAPSGICTDGANLYVVDGNCIRRIHLASGEVSTLAGSDAVGNADGIGSSASFNHPFGIASDSIHLYVTDAFNNSIRRIRISNAKVTTIAGSGEIGSTDGIGHAATFKSPFGITFHRDHLYVADTMNNRIRRIAIANGEVSTLAGTGISGANDGQAGNATFSVPFGITADGKNLYVADTFNSKIRRIDIASGEVTTLAGTGTYGAEDGTGLSASFRVARGITSDGTFLYVADTGNDSIRCIDIASGNVMTLAGTGSIGRTNGDCNTSTFNSPTGIVCNGQHLYVTDSANRLIRRIE